MKNKNRARFFFVNLIVQQLEMSQKQKREKINETTTSNQRDDDNDERDDKTNFMC